jgi:antirestriction protein ArdC
VLLWKSAVKHEDDAENPGQKVDRKILLARTFYVFNADQCEGLPARFYPQAGAPVEDLADPQAVLDGYLAQPGAPSFAYDGGDHAYYLPGPDEIHVPPVTSYLTAEERYSTGFHEAGHSTGHPSRLNREGIAQWDEFGSDRYSREELVAEATSALLCAVTGIDTEVVFTNSAAYLANWARKLRDDPHLIVTAASQAFKAADLIQGISDEYAEHEPEHEQAVELAA